MGWTGTLQAGGRSISRNGQVSLDTAKQGIVLLRNTGNVLPLAKTAKSIAVIGGYADTGAVGRGSARCMARAVRP
jgi:beta-glucosidase